MGSHGGATAAGQAAILEGLGLTETAIGVPIRSSMDVCRIGKAAGGFAPETKLFKLPFLFTSRDEAYKILDGPIGTEMAENLLKIGIRSLGWYENGFRHITNNVRPINSLKDMEGIKIRVMEDNLFIRSMKAMGGSPLPMAFGELYTADHDRLFGPDYLCAGYCCLRGWVRG